MLPAVLGAAAVLVVVLLVVLLGRDDSDDASTSTTSQSAATATTVPTTVAPTTTIAPTTTGAPTTTDTATTTTTSVPPATGAFALTQAADDGVHSLSGPRDVLVAAERVEIAFAVGDGSYLVQNRHGRFNLGGMNDPADTEIRRIGTVSRVIVPAVPGQWHALHDVEVVGGRTLALISTSQGSTMEDWREDLYLIDLATGERRDVGLVAAWEEGVARLHLTSEGLIVGTYYASVVKGPLFWDFGANRAIDPASLGLEDAYTECDTCPELFSVSATGDRLAWVADGQIVVYDLRARTRLATLPLGEVAGGRVDSLEVSSSSVVVNFVDPLSGDALVPVVLGLDGSRTPLARRGFATID